MSEWLKEHDWKSCNGQKPFGGSNPPLSARLSTKTKSPEMGAFFESGTHWAPTGMHRKAPGWGLGYVRDFFDGVPFQPTFKRFLAVTNTPSRNPNPKWPLPPPPPVRKGTGLQLEILCGLVSGEQDHWGISSAVLRAYSCEYELTWCSESASNPGVRSKERKGLMGFADGSLNLGKGRNS